MALQDKARTCTFCCPCTLATACVRINEAFLATGNNEQQMFQMVCDELVESSIVAGAWVGLVNSNDYNINPVAWAGKEKGYLKTATLKWDESVFGNGPTGIAIKTKDICLVDDIEISVNYAPWREKAIDCGYKSVISIPLKYESVILGAITLYSRQKYAFKKTHVTFLINIANNLALEIKSLRLEKSLQDTIGRLSTLVEGTINVVGSIIDMRDAYTAGHQRRVSQLSLEIAKQMDLPKIIQSGVNFAARLHDVGKIIVPAEILSKPGKISDLELHFIRSHAQAGFDVLKEIEFPYPIAKVVHQHHERLDGSGYPLGLHGHEICLEARIVSVADVVEAMSSHRPYRPGLGVEKALEEIEKFAGKLYDPDVVQACLSLFHNEAFQFQEI